MLGVKGKGKNMDQRKPIVICPVCGCKQYEIGEGTMFCTNCDHNLGPAPSGNTNFVIGVVQRNALRADLAASIEGQRSAVDQLTTLRQRISDLEAKLAEAEVERDRAVTMHNCLAKMHGELREERNALRAKLAEAEASQVAYLLAWDRYRDALERIMVGGGEPSQGLLRQIARDALEGE